MSYLPSKIPLREALALTVKNTGAASDIVKEQFRQALLLGDIRAEGRIWRHGSSGGWDWTPLESIPRSFFDDNKSTDDCGWLASVFGGYDEIPEPLRGKEPYIGHDGTQQVDAAGTPIFEWTVTPAGRAMLEALRRPDFERNCTGEVGNPMSFDRIARDLHVLREDVERVFPPSAIGAEEGNGSQRQRGSKRGAWKERARRYLKHLAENDPDSYPVTGERAASMIREALGLAEDQTPRDQTVKNWLSTDKILESVKREVESARRIWGS